jgi:hypothetical protein
MQVLRSLPSRIQALDAELEALMNDRDALIQAAALGCAIPMVLILTQPLCCGWQSAITRG